ncbi:hypothetical protein AMK13_10410 [Streptomyces sp. CB02056]|nr:hypothetical protein AMK13_10410 [Streptomyces sp. CB02056]
MAHPTPPGSTPAIGTIRLAGSAEFAAAALAALHADPRLDVVRVSRLLAGDAVGEVRQYIRARRIAD